MTAQFDWHILSNGEVIDRATQKHIALRRMAYLYGFGEYRMRSMELLHVPSGAVVARSGIRKGRQGVYPVEKREAA